LGLDLEIMLKTIPALWGQYCDLQVARNQTAPLKSTNAEKSVESYSL